MFKGLHFWVCDVFHESSLPRPRITHSKEVYCRDTRAMIADNRELQKENSKSASRQQTEVGQYSVNRY